MLRLRHAPLAVRWRVRSGAPCIESTTQRCVDRADDHARGWDPAAGGRGPDRRVPRNGVRHRPRQLFGSARLFADDAVRSLYRDRAYVAQWCDAVDQLVHSGALRPEDAQAMKARRHRPLRSGTLRPTACRCDCAILVMLSDTRTNAASTTWHLSEALRVTRGSHLRAPVGRQPRDHPRGARSHRSGSRRSGSG
jgi:hypothetical protein